LPAARSAAWCRRFRNKDWRRSQTLRLKPQSSWPGLSRPSTFLGCSSEERRGCPAHLARRRASRFCPGMTPFFSLAGKLPINAMPVQRHDDARPDSVAHAVRSSTPRHHRSSPGRRASGSGARGASSVPLHPGRAGPGPLGLARLGPVRLRLARLSLGLDHRRPLDIFRGRFRSFRAFRSIGSPGGRRSGLRLVAAQRQAPVASLGSGGC
jgi:hypothetical protein